MVDDSRKLLLGWKYPLSYITTGKDDIDSKIVDVLLEEGVPKELIRKADNDKLEFLDFVAHINSNNRNELVIAIITSVDKNPQTGRRRSYSEVPFREIPLSKEEWMRRLHF